MLTKGDCGKVKTKFSTVYVLYQESPQEKTKLPREFLESLQTLYPT